MHYFNQLSRDEIDHKIKRQITIMQTKLDNFIAARNDMITRQVDPYRIKIIEYGISVQKTKILWLEDLLASRAE